MECIRQLLQRCGEALFLLQLLSQHLLARLIQKFDANVRQAVVQLTFHQLVCSEDGDRLATRLISALMEVIKILPVHHLITFLALETCVNVVYYSPCSFGYELPSQFSYMNVCLTSTTLHLSSITLVLMAGAP